MMEMMPLMFCRQMHLMSLPAVASAVIVHQLVGNYWLWRNYFGCWLSLALLLKPTVDYCLIISQLDIVRLVVHLYLLCDWLAGLLQNLAMLSRSDFAVADSCKSNGDFSLRVIVSSQLLHPRSSKTDVKVVFEGWCWHCLTTALAGDMSAGGSCILTCRAALDHSGLVPRPPLCLLLLVDADVVVVCPLLLLTSTIETIQQKSWMKTWQQWWWQ